MLFESSEYEASLEAARATLENADSLSALEQSQLHQYAAFNLIALNRQREARLHAREALHLNPDLSLDPVMISPKIIDLFESVRQEMAPPKPAVADTTTDSAPRASDRFESEKSLIQPGVIHSQPDLGKAFKRSLLFPGLGQMTLDQQTKGRLLMGAEILCLSGIVVSHLQQESAHDAYLNRTEPDAIEDAFNRYEKWYHARTGFAIAAGAVWLYNLIDVSLYTVESTVQVDRDENFPMIGLRYPF